MNAWNIIWGFVNSNFFISLVTFIVGGFAIFLYWKQKRDNKKDAANIILLEVQNAERQLAKIREMTPRDSVAKDTFLMQAESWGKYRYLFVRDFDQNEWDTLTTFYDKCRLYDESITYNNSFFPKNEEQIRISMQRVTADYLKDASEKEDPDEQTAIIVKAEKFQELFLKQAHLLQYDPKKPVNDAKQYLESVPDNLSQTSIGIKLKKIADLKP